MSQFMEITRVHAWFLLANLLCYLQILEEPLWLSVLPVVYTWQSVSACLSPSLSVCSRRNWKMLPGISMLKSFATTAFKLSLRAHYAPMWNSSQILGAVKPSSGSDVALPVWNIKLLIKNQLEKNVPNRQKPKPGISRLHASSQHLQLLP